MAGALVHKQLRVAACAEIAVPIKNAATRLPLRLTMSCLRHFQPHRHASRSQVLLHHPETISTSMVLVLQIEPLLSPSS